MRVLWRGTVGEGLPSCCGVPYPGDVVYNLSSSKTTAEDASQHSATSTNCSRLWWCLSTSDGLPARQRQATHGTGHPGIPGTAQHHHNGLASFKSGSEPHRALVGRDSAHDQPTPVINHPVVTQQQLRQAVVDTYNNVSRAFIRNLFLSMGRRCAAVMASNGRHTRY